VCDARALGVPPNWPPHDPPGLDWRPDPAWGPLPVGWTLWRRRRGHLMRRRSSRAAGLVATVTLSALMAGVLQDQQATGTGGAPASWSQTATSRPSDWRQQNSPPSAVLRGGVIGSTHGASPETGRR
jgi:hypothetical protein